MPNFKLFDGAMQNDPVVRDKALPDARGADIDLGCVPGIEDLLRVPAPPTVGVVAIPRDTKQELRVPIARAEAIMEEQLKILSEWADTNSNFAEKDRFRYWVLKVPALVSTVSVSALEAFGYGQAVIVSGVLAAFCVGIDAAFPGGQLHNIHKRATNEIRRLQQDVLTKWRQAQLGPAEELVSATHAILKDIQENRAKIDTYVTEAEASLGKADSTQAASTRTHP